MRVTHVITRLVVGGAQENTIATVRGLLGKNGVEANLISGPSIGPEGSLETELGSAAASASPLTVLDDLVRPINPWKDICAWRDLTRAFQHSRPDIVHTHSGKAGILGRLAAKRAGVPVIVHTIHGPSFGAFQSYISNSLLLAAERRAGRVTTHFVTVADAMRDQYLAAGIGEPGRYTRILSGFDLKPFLKAQNDLNLRARYSLSPDDIVVGKISRLFKLKGHDDLFAIAAGLIEACPRIKFLLVGGGEWRARFERMARDLGMQRRFIFTGLVSPADVPGLVGIMDLLVHLSKREGLPRALPQALAAGKPVIAYDADGAREVCLDNQHGYLIRIGHLNRLKESVLQLAGSPEQRREFGERGRAFVSKRFAVEQMVDAIYELYLRLVREHDLPRT